MMPHWSTTKNLNSTYNWIYPIIRSSAAPVNLEEIYILIYHSGRRHVSSGFVTLCEWSIRRYDDKAINLA